MPNDRSNLELMLHSRSYPMQYASEFAEASITAVGDEVSPATPTGVVATAIASGIRITWTLPTTNIDGTAMTDLRWHRIYYHTGAGIDISNPATYTDFKVVGPVDEYTDEPITAGTARYFVVTALDRTGNESPASSEVHATSGSVVPTSGIPDDATGLIFDDSVSGDGIVLGDGIIGIVFNTPDPAWGGFSHYELEYAEDKNEGAGFGAWVPIPNVPQTAYIHKSLTTTSAYKYRAYAVGTDGTNEVISTTPDIEDNGGAGFLPAEGDNEFIIAVLVLAEYIIATNEIRAPMIKAGVITADKLSFTAYIIGTNDLDDVVDGGTYSRVLTTDITAGHILLTEATGDIDDIDDGATYSKVLKTDVSAGHILLSAATGDLGDIADGGGYSRVATTDITAGHITVVSSSASININSAVWQNQGIQLQYNAGTPRAYMGDGGVTSGDRYFMFDGANISFQGVNTSLTAAGLFSCSNITITGAGSTWAGAVLGTAYIPNLDAGKITTGSLVVGRTDAKCTDANADQTSANTAAAIAGQGNLATLDTVGTTEIDGNSVRTTQIYLDGNLQFKPGATHNAAIGIDGLFYSDLAATTNGCMYLQSTGVIVYAGSTANNQVELRSDYGILLAHGGDTTTKTHLATDGAFRWLDANDTYTRVYNANAPTSWTDLDLSSVIGARRALVILLVEDNGIQCGYRFRPNGESWEQDEDVHTNPGVFGCRCAIDQENNYALCITDASGIVEWKAGATSSTEVWVIGYIA